jgi:hypothetical protein
MHSSVVMLAPEFDVRGFPMTFTRQFVIAVSFIILVTIAHAKTTCVFQTNNVTKTMTLVADCTTDTTIQLPAGFTLNGAKHLITAVDPAGGNFNGAVVANEVVDSTINVKNLVIDMPNLATGNCVFVQGISFNQASGAITGNTILHVGQSGYCPNTGTGISVGAPLFSSPQVVAISGNKVLLASANALFVSGPFDAAVTENEFSINNLGTDAVEFLAQSGSFTQNTIETDPNGQDNQEAFVIFNNVANVKVTSNTINLISGRAAYGIDLFDANNPITVSGNRVFSHGPIFNGVGIYNGTAGSTITNNKIRCYNLPIAGSSGKGNVTLPCPF